MSTLVYTCPKCGADLTDICIATYPPSYYKECFKCGWRSNEEKEEIIRVPYPEYLPKYQAQPYTNEACAGCSNHPSNGGSGICNCILGTPTIT